MTPVGGDTHREQDVLGYVAKFLRIDDGVGIKRIHNGRINETWLVEANSERFGLQLMGDDATMDGYRLLSQRFHRIGHAGLRVPRIVPTLLGQDHLITRNGKRLRLLTWIDGVHPSPPISLPEVWKIFESIAKFHIALNDGQEADEWPRISIQSTEAVMRNLEAALQPPAFVFAESSLLAADILTVWRESREYFRDSTPCLAGHGDLQSSNILIQSKPRFSLGIVDLDTVGWLSLGDELGDALRSVLLPEFQDLVMKKSSDICRMRSVVDVALDGYRFGLRNSVLEKEMVSSLSLSVIWRSISRVVFNLSARFCLAAFGRINFEPREQGTINGYCEFHRMAYFNWAVFQRISKQM